MSDEALVQAFWERCEEAITEAKAQYGTYCLYIANNILRSREDSEECLNDVLLAAWESIPPKRPKNLKTYLGKLIRETAISRWRKNNASKRIPADSVVPLDELEEMVGESRVEESLDEALLSRSISSFLRTLNETERNVFVRRYWYYDAVESICTRYGFSKGKVSKMLKRTRDKLAEHLKKEGYIL